MSVCRCTICNAVNYVDVETNIGDFTTSRFYEEADGGYICFTCRGYVDEALEDFIEEEEDDEDE